MRVFTWIWFGQFVSLAGSGLTRFAFGVWVYQKTGSVADYAVMFVFATLPGLLVTPFAGVWVDRWDRRKVMLVSDTVAGGFTVLAAVLFFSDALQLWHIYLISAGGAVCGCFQWLGYRASIAMLVPKEQLVRANGMTIFSRSVSGVLVPIVAGYFVGVIGFTGLVLIDVASFLVAVGTLVLVRFPALKPGRRSATSGKPSVIGEALEGWHYITARQGLLAQLVFVATLNFCLSLASVLLTPMVLDFATPKTLGTVLSGVGVGTVLGSSILVAWGGPKRHMFSVLFFSGVMGLGLALEGFYQNVAAIFIGAGIVAFCFPFVDGGSTALWQTKVDLGIQGRVFALRGMATWISKPFAYLLAAPLVTWVFEPMLLSGGWLAQEFGDGPGRSKGLALVVLGVLVLLLSLCGWAYRPLRRLDLDLADAEGPVPVAEDDQTESKD